MARKLASDKILFTAVVLLLLLGLVMVSSASTAVARTQVEGDGPLRNPFLLKQLVAAAVGLVALLVTMHVDYRHLKRPAVIYTLLGLLVVLLAAVLLQTPSNGARRWFFFGPFAFQPSELAKLVLLPYVAYQIDKKAERVNSPELLLPVVGFTGLVTVLILCEPDLGTPALLLGVVLLMVFLAGLSWRYLALGGAVLGTVLTALLLLVGYRRERLLVFLDPESDSLGAGYQVLQSLIAVGAGGVFGVGLSNSGQKLFFLPHPHTDFIYAIIAEELGLIGAVTVLALFLVVLWRGFRAALHAPDTFGRFLAFGLTAALVLQALVNISVALALLPTKGIPLPFLSYGGSSLVVSLTACGVLLNISEHGG